MSNHVTRFPTGFDYVYRPQSYFQDIDPKALILSSILGEERRKDVQQRLESGHFDPAVWGEWLTESKLDDGTRQLIGSIHPAFMGGEYLPQFGQNEIEIVRIVLASVTQDVISIRARRAGKRIAYRVVDEYETEFALPRKSSSTPISLRQLISFVDGTNHAHEDEVNGLVFSVLDANIGNCELESLRGFVSVNSVFYPELQRYYDAESDQYLDQFVLQEDEDDEEEEEEEIEDDEPVGEPDAAEDQGGWANLIKELGGVAK